MSNKTMTGAKAIVRCLEQEGITTVFGLPGAAICPFYDALSDSYIRHILVRQEQHAGHAASGYARMTGKPAVCVATSGPGALNLLTAIATAYMDSVPLIAITGQVDSELLGRDVFQEADITGAAEPFVKHSYLISNVNEIPKVLKHAFHIAGTGRKGPVLIDIPIDMQTATLEFDYPQKAEIRSYKPSINGHIGQIKRAISAIKSSEKPLLCVGGGVFSANAHQEVFLLSDSLNIPVVTTMMGISCISPCYRLNLGMIGMYGRNTANRAMNEADLLILIGARVGDRAIMSPMGLSKTTKIIHIDIDPAEIGKNIDTDIPIVGDIKNVLTEIIERANGINPFEWTSPIYDEAHTYINSTKSVDPRELISKLMCKAKENACIVADVGQHQIWTAQGYKLNKGRFITSGGMGTMGYALPCAIGAKLAGNDRQVIAVCGDGGFQMSMMELATICENNVGVKIVIINNSTYGMVKELQDKKYNSNNIAVSLDGNPDFVKIANAYGIRSERLTSSCGIDDAVNKLLKDDSPFLLECVVSADFNTF